MADLSGSPYVELRFDAAGTLAEGDASALQAALDTPGVENLVVLSHGWKFEPPGPRLLYEALWKQVVPALGGRQGAYVVAGVVWPSKRYTEGIDAERMMADPGLAGTLAADGDGDGPVDLTDAELDAALNAALESLYGADAPVAEALADFRADPLGEGTAETLLRAVLSKSSVSTGDAELADAGTSLKALPDDMGGTLAIFAQPPRLEPTPEAAQTLGLAEAVRGFFTGPRAAMVRVLEQLSYFEMKARAGVVGKGLGGVLSGMAPPRPMRLHLVGHSFGARVVTAAAAAFTAPPQLSLFSLTLLQGAFSHNGLSASRKGAFHDVIGKPSGPLVISHTHRDRACTVMYAIASRISGDITKGFGGADDRFGAMGANGAQFDRGEAAAIVGARTAPFTPARGKITNFCADGYITDHNDITNPAVGRLVAEVLLA